MKKGMDFEKAMTRLDEIIASLDSGSLSLEQTLDLFGEGAELVAFCNKTLDKARLKVETLANAGKDGEDQE